MIASTVSVHGKMNRAVIAQVDIAGSNRKKVGKEKSMDNCSTCRWRKDLVKFTFTAEGRTRTYQDGYACLANSCENEVVWMVGNSQYNSRCDMYTGKEEP